MIRCHTSIPSHLKPGGLKHNLQKKNYDILGCFCFEPQTAVISVSFHSCNHMIWLAPPPPPQSGAPLCYRCSVSIDCVWIWFEFWNAWGLGLRPAPGCRERDLFGRCLLNYQMKWTATCGGDQVTENSSPCKPVLGCFQTFIVYHWVSK